MLILLSFIGGVTTYAMLLSVIGIRHVRQLYLRHELVITHASGLMFIGVA